MPVRTEINLESDITKHIASGSVIDEEMFEAQREFYENGPTRLQLWDMTECVVKEVTIGGMRSFIGKAAQLGQSRKNGRTAVIVQSELQYGLGRMAEAFAEFVSIPFEFRIFRGRAEALAWLNEETKEGERMNETPVYESESTVKNLWQDYRIFSNRVEIDWLFGCMTIPFENIERVVVSESEVKGLMRGDLQLKGFRPALKVDWANFVEHVVIDKDDGHIHRILLTPHDPEEFVKSLGEALSRYGQDRDGVEG